VLVTLAERENRQSNLALLPNKPANVINKAIIRALRPHATQVYTIIYDNSKKFARHTEIASALDTRGYFVHPYHPWGRRPNENMNNLIRQNLPKGKSFDSLIPG
jgi:transposase, IS30 family